MMTYKQILRQFLFFLMLGSIFLFPSSIFAALHQRASLNSANTQTQKTNTELSLPAFSGIDVNGNFQVLVSHGRHQRVVLTGHPMAMNRVSASVRGNTLVLRMAVTRSESYPYDSRVRVHITTPSALSKIYVAGHSTLRGIQINTNHLQITTQDNASVDLRGNKLHIHQIENHGQGLIQLGFIQENNLSIVITKSGLIRVFGSVHRLTARLQDRSCLEAERLRANQAYVETRDYAIAKVQPIQKLYAFAKGISNIYYFGTPKKLSGYSQDAGNVIKIPTMTFH